MKKKIPVYAWYFPNWHIGEPLNEKWHGKGWSEWRCVQYAVKRFEDHQLFHPLWGYEDEADPLVMGKKIDTAKEYGIDGFFWDFYWFESVGGYRMKALEAFTEAMKSRKDFKMALMWCNHDPIYVHPASYRDEGRMLLDGDLSEDGFFAGTQYMIDNCFRQDWYLHINHQGQEKLYFVLWHLPKLVNGLGGMEKARQVLDRFRERVRTALGKELYLAIVPRNLELELADAPVTKTQYLQALGIDGCVTYNWAVYPKPEDVWPETSYAHYVDCGIRSFTEDTDAIALPLNITVTQGWDSSARTVPSDMYEPLGFPFTWITRDKNPEDFKRGLVAAREFYESDRFTGDFITLSTWNEWTEGNPLEPSLEHGYAYLEAVREVFGTADDPK